MSMMDLLSVREVAESRLWTDGEVIKHVVYPVSASSPSLLNSFTATSSSPTFQHVETFTHAASIADEFRWSVAEMKRVRSHGVPLALRRRLWAKLNKMAAAGSEYDYDDEEEEEEIVEEGEEVAWLLKALKREWRLVEQDGREVEFEEGLGLGLGEERE